MKMIVAVALGGSIGAVGRYLVNSALLRPGSDLPVATFAVNMGGSFLIGALVSLLALRLEVSPEMRAFLVTGFLGGLTTFSAFSLELGLMAEKKQYALALGYGSASVAGGLAAFLLGMAAVRAVS